MIFQDGINLLYEELMKFIKEYESLPDSAPFDLTIFRLLKDDFLLFKEKNSQIASNCEANLVTNSEKFDLVMKEYNFESISLNKSFYNIKKAIENETKTNIKKLRDDIEAEKNENKNHTIGKEMEIEWAFLSNEQSSQLIKDEHKNAISRFDYQREHYKNVYNESVKDFNSELQYKINKENEKYEQEKSEFEANSSAIIDRYEENILAESDVLTKYTSDFSAKQTEQRESNYQDTVDLNDRIRNLFTSNNRKLIEEKTDYIKDQNINKLEKDLNRQSFLYDSQSVSRTFVSKMTKLDEKIDEIRNEYNTNLSNETKSLQFKLLKLHKVEEKEIASILASTTDKKEQKTLINKISKKYYNLAREEKKKSNELIKQLNIKFSIESENDSHNKKILDLNRSYDLKIVAEKEQRDNKYFQELNNMDENDFTFKTKRHNNEYKAAANLVRLENSLKEVESKAEYDKINAGHQKEIQNLLTKVKIIRSELDCYKKFQNKISELDKYRHDRIIQYLTVNTLLDIEKCKVLMEYNERKYQHNVNNAKNTLGAGDIKLKNQNNRIKDIIHAELKIDSEVSRAKIEKLEHEIRIAKQMQADSLIRVERDNKYNSENLISNVLFERFKLEIKSLESIATAYTLIIKELEHLSTAVFDDVLDNIKLKQENLQIVRTFFYRYLTKVSEFYANLVKEIISLSYEIIDKRIKFEKEFKYKSDYDSLMIEFNSKISNKQEEKNTQAYEVDNLCDEIENKKQTIFAIRNQIAYLKNTHSYSKEKNYKEKLKSLIQEKKNEETNLEILEKKLVPLKARLDKIDDELNEIQSENEKKENQINDLQRDGAESYYDLKRALSNLFESIKNSFTQRILKTPDDPNCQNYESIMQERRKDLIKFDNEIIKKLYSSINNFRKASTSTINKADTVLKTEYSKDCINLDNMANENVLAMRAIIDNDKDDSLEYIKVLESEKNAIIRHHDRIEKEFNEFVNNTSIKASREAKKIDDTFYSEYYAISSNQKDINNDYIIDIKKADKDADLARIEYIKNTTLIKEQLELELKRYIITRNDYINDIPIRARSEKENLNKEAKEKNKALYQEKLLDKTNYIRERSEHFTKIKEINGGMELRIKNIEAERKRKIRKEKRAHLIRIKKLTFALR